MTRRMKNKTLNSGGATNAHAHTTSTSPIAPLGDSSNLQRGETSSTVSTKPPRGPNSRSISIPPKVAPKLGSSKHIRSKSQSTVSTPTSSEFSIIGVSSIVNQSKNYLARLISSLESGENDVDMFVLLLQNINNSDESPLRQDYDERSIMIAVSEMIQDTISLLIQKRDEIGIRDEQSQRKWNKLDTIIAELVIKQDSIF